jgi:hypothetical protein
MAAPSAETTAATVKPTTATTSPMKSTPTTAMRAATSSTVTTSMLCERRIGHKRKGKDSDKKCE